MKGTSIRFARQGLDSQLDWSDSDVNHCQQGVALLLQRLSDSLSTVLCADHAGAAAAVVAPPTAAKKLAFEDSAAAAAAVSDRQSAPEDVETASAAPSATLEAPADTPSALGTATQHEAAVSLQKPCRHCAAR